MDTVAPSLLLARSPAAGAAGRRQISLSYNPLFIAQVMKAPFYPRRVLGTK